MRAAMYTFATFATLAAITSFTSPAHADQETDRASRIGSWVQSGGNNAWVINTAADGLHITQIEGSGTVADYQCNLNGSDCDVKVAGHKAAVSMYFNGATLIQIETKGDQIVKRRFTILPSGTQMKLEIIPMAEHTQTEELQFERGQPAVARKK
jgi:hypothetical protein